MICPYCGSEMLLRDSSVIYTKSFGNAFVCAKYPACDTYVGCHKGGRLNNRPLGTPANAELRRARKLLLHNLFDPLWKHCCMGRHAAYRFLAESMQIPPEECHIGMFDLARCREAWKHTIELHRKHYGRQV